MDKTILEQDLSGTYLFISFDLVNSTAYKSSEPHWPSLFNNFFDFCRLSTQDYFPTAQEWKMIGDEMLFYLPVIDLDELVGAPDRVFALLNRCNAFIEEQDESGVLSVKGTLWSAVVQEQRLVSERLEGANYLLRAQQAGRVILDFLGPDIDAGFRVGSFARRGKLVIGADLAYLLIEEYERRQESCRSEGLRIVSLEVLKGVWQGRHYPIIWFHDAWDHPAELFAYDEPLISPLIASILNAGICDTPNINQLEKIFRDVQRVAKRALLRDGIEHYHRNNWGETIQYQVPMERLSELHLVAFCLNEKRQVLVARRKRDDLWDFGCSSLMMYQSIEASLQRGYKEDFGVELQEIDGEFPPVATYSYAQDAENRTVPGIMFLADVSGQRVDFDRYKYSEIRWLNRASSEEISAAEAVPGFHERLERAVAVAGGHHGNC